MRTTKKYEPTAGSEYTSDVIWQYQDGLGREIQSVHQGHAESGQDIVGVTRYDNMDRKSKVYEVFESTTSNGGFVSSIPNNQDYTLLEYKSSPRNRLIRQTPPTWYPTHTKYESNGGVKSTTMKRHRFIPKIVCTKGQSSTR